MSHNDLTFFTNEPERNLYERFNKILNSNTQFFDILVGYFRTSGFFRMYPAMEGVEKIRVLVGLNVDRKTVEIIDIAKKQENVEELSSKEAKEAISSTIKKEFVNSEDSADVEKGVLTFIKWLKSGKLEMRIYAESPIHAKVYIMRKDMNKTPDMYGSVITGSSNFSESGLKNNLEFNVELKDSRDVDFALEHFEKLWAKGVDISSTYIDTVETQTWLRGDITPYELYLKTLYEYFIDQINADKDMVMEKLLPDGYMRLQYQIDAVTQAKERLEAYNGVFISDVVGLGKTYICALLAKSLKKSRKLVICPPVLVDYWKDVLEEFDVAATVESLGKLDKIIDKGIDKYDYIFIDEAHRFRNQSTQSFALLHQICHGKKVILVSATPINNYSSDIANQIFLFQPKHNSTIMPNVKNIDGFFATLKGRLGRLDKGTPEYKAMLRKNSEEIRDKVLRNIMIRRTRGEIKEFYAEDLDRQGLTFPKLGTPEQIIYAFDAETEAAFSETISVIKEFSYARYKPLTYLKDTDKYATLMVSQLNMSGFMKSILVKRLESSFYAFRKTLGRFIESYEKFINMVEKGDIYISKKFDIYDLLDSGDDEKLMKYVENEDAVHFRSDEFKPKFLPALKMDLSRLRMLEGIWDGVTTDPKLDAFKQELITNKLLKGNKKIIFTESKETAEYIGEELKSIYKDRIVVFSGSSNNALKIQIEDSFNPKNEHKKNDKYDVLITTDVLAEGVNLHRSNVLINYDLPWNPTRIMQRVGRINRVGTAFDQIYVFNFFPTSQSNKHLPIKDRIIEKLQAFHDTLGEDFKYLSEDEEIGHYRLYEELTKSMEEEEGGTNPELAYLSIIRGVRDNNIDLFDKIKKLPSKSKAGRISKLVSENQTITFLKMGELKMFFKSKSDDETEELSFMDSIRYIKADANEKRIAVSEEYYKHLGNNKDAFDYRLIEEEIVTLEKPKIMGNSSKIINLLKAISKCRQFTEEEDNNINRMLELWTNGDIPHNITKEILKDMKIFKIEDPIKAYHEIFELIPDQYFKEKETAIKGTSGRKQIILSCFLRKENN